MRLSYLLCRAIHFNEVYGVHHRSVLAKGTYDDYCSMYDMGGEL